MTADRGKAVPGRQALAVPAAGLAFGLPWVAGAVPARGVTDATAGGAAASAPRFAPADLVEDFRIARAALEEAHPSLTRFA